MATPNASPSPIATRALPFREDCWSEEATATLVDAWGRRYMELNRGNLRQKDWQEVADTVNALHGNTPKTHRTDVQCKNRIDTLKKKYKVEKAKVVESNGGYRSSWGFFERLDGLIGVNYDKLQQVQQIQQREFSADLDSTPVGVPLTYRKMGLPPPVAAVVHSQTPPQMVGYRKVGLLSPQPAAVVRAETPPQMVGYRKMGLSPSPPLGETPPKMLNLPQKRGASEMAGSCFRRNYSAMAAAAAKPVMDEEEDEEEEDVEEEDVDAEENGEVEGVRKLAKAIERFGEVYERVEEMKQRQMVELEKQRMQFTKDLEVQRMQLFMDTQVQLEKIKRAKHSAGESGDGIEFDISEVFHQFNQFICNFM